MLDVVRVADAVWTPGRFRLGVVRVQFSDAAEPLPPGWIPRVVAEADAYFREASAGAVRWLPAADDPVVVRLRRPAGEWRLKRRSLADRVRFWKRVTAGLPPAADAVLVVVPSTTPLRGCFAVGPRWNSPRLAGALRPLGGTVQRGAVVKALTPWGTVVHELGHVLGLPDLYDYEYNRRHPRSPILASRFVGPWDLMGRVPSEVSGHRPYPMAWTRMIAGWLRPAEWRPDRTRYSVEAGPSGEAVRVPIRPGLWMFVEARLRHGFDAVLPGEGVLVSIVDDDVSEGRGPVRLLGPARRPSTRRSARRTLPHANAALQVGDDCEFAGYQVRVLAHQGQGFDVSITHS